MLWGNIVICFVVLALSLLLLASIHLPSTSTSTSLTSTPTSTSSENPFLFYFPRFRQVLYSAISHSILLPNVNVNDK